MADLQGKVAIVIGGERGIGQAVVEHLTSLVVRVTATVVDNAPARVKRLVQWAEKGLPII